MLSWKAAETPDRGSGAPGDSLEELTREVGRLRKRLLKHGHAQELFQERVERQIRGLSGHLDRTPSERRSGGSARDLSNPNLTDPDLSDPQLRALVGYSTYRGLLGHVDQQDPATLIDPAVETDMVWRRIRS